MLRHKAQVPAPAESGNRHPDLKRIGRLYVPAHSISETATPRVADFAAHLIAARYHLPPHIASLVASLAGIGQREAA